MESLSINWSKKDWAKQALSEKFYARDTIEVAKDLLGKILIVKTKQGLTAGRIVETEAYLKGDPAAHSCRGETPRSKIMFGRPGVAYVYFIYGMYEMLNFVTEPVGHPGAVLIRAIEPVFGEELMKKRRPGKSLAELARGPGKLCRAMGIEMNHNGETLRGPALFVLPGERSEKICASRRVGITKGVEPMWRFFLQDNSFVSRVKENAECVVCR